MKQFIFLYAIMILLSAVGGYECSAAEGGAYYTIHGASYQKLDNAIRNVDAVKAAGYEAHYQKVTIPGKGIWYRVYIGRYRDKGSAHAVAEKLEARHVIDAFTLQEYSAGEVPSTAGGKRAARNVGGTQAGTANSPANRKNGKSRGKSPEERGAAARPADRKGGNPASASLKTETTTAAAEGETGEAASAEIPAAASPGAAPSPAPGTGIRDAEPYEAALRHLDAGRYEQALQAFKTLDRQKLDPEKQEQIRLLLADCYYFLGERGGYQPFLSAVDYYKEILGRYPDPREGNDRIYYRLALSYENLKFYYEALRAFESLLLKYPDSAFAPEAAFKEGLMLRETRRPGKAIEKLSAYLKKYPEGKFAPIAAFSIGDCYYQMRQQDNADAWYGYVQKKWPAFLETSLGSLPREVLRNFGNHALQMRRFAEAVAVFSLHLSLYPGDEHARAVLSGMAGAYGEMGQHLAAIKLLSHLIERFPESKETTEAVFTIANLGVTNPGLQLPAALAGVNHYQEPLKTYDSLYAKFPVGNLAERVLLQKALALTTYGRNREAFDTYILLVKQFPRSRYLDEAGKNLSRTVTQLINASYEAGDHVAVADLYFRAFAGGLLKNGDSDVLWKSVTSLKTIGLYGEAVSVLNVLAKSSRDTQDETNVALALAELDRLMGKDDDAEQKLQGLLKKPAKDGEGTRNAKLALADIYVRKKMYEKALSLYAEILGAAGEALEGAASDHLSYAIALREKNMPAPALANYEKAVKAYTRNRENYPPSVATDAYLGWGDSLYDQKHYREGLALYQQSLNSAPEQNYRLWSLYHLGQGYAKLNDAPLAEKAFNQLKESGKEGFWEKVANYWLDDNKWREQHIRHLK